jgi:sugar O-acyltransferase (sialic acid O-acetyltransferase NeuD family)
MKHLVIVGAGGFGREMYGAALNAVGCGELFVVKGFLDARADALAGFAGYPPVIGSPDGYVPAEGDVFVTALGSIEARRRCAAALEARGAEFVPIIDRTAFLGPNVRVGAGAYIARNVVLTADIEVGRHACVFHNASIGHDTMLGDFSHVYAQCAVGGAVRVGEGAAIYPGAVVMPRRTIGSGAVVGAGAVVALNVRDDETVFGNPAAPVGRFA